MIVNFFSSSNGTKIDIFYNNFGWENTFGTATGISVGTFSQVCFGTWKHFSSGT